MRPGGHEMAVADWKAILDFPDRELTVKLEGKKIR